jgi:hypothetical protein
MTVEIIKAKRDERKHERRIKTTDSWDINPCRLKTGTIVQKEPTNSIFREGILLDS